MEKETTEDGKLGATSKSKLIATLLKKKQEMKTKGTWTEEPPKVEPPKVEPPKVEPPKVEPPKVALPAAAESNHQKRQVSPPVYISLDDIKYKPKMTTAQKEAMAKFKIRRDKARNLKANEVRDELGAMLKPKVLSLQEVFDFAKKYGIEDSEIRRWKKTPNPGTLRMSLGNRLRPLIAKSIGKNLKKNA